MWEGRVGAVGRESWRCGKGELEMWAAILGQVTLETRNWVHLSKCWQGTQSKHKYIYSTYTPATANLN